MKVTLGIPVILSHSSKPDFKAVLEANIHCSVQWRFFFFPSSPTPQLNFSLTDTNCPNVHFAVEVQLFSASERKIHPVTLFLIFSFSVHIVKISPKPSFLVLSPDPFLCSYYYHYYCYYYAFNDSWGSWCFLHSSRAFMGDVLEVLASFFMHWILDGAVGFLRHCDHYPGNEQWLSLVRPLRPLPFKRSYVPTEQPGLPSCDILGLMAT